ncbi:uncharacterized protein LOC132739011 [Ruditapes philippinarum]|uniref:uncharacterized protein LOC132739011 n=1 Tax=Ruditapes philippinarum TaxID=129788 RepID=UPI00295BB2C7|nr:uncharacterized protein LOC132739011 [Ruditapes philippinarum]
MLLYSDAANFCRKVGKDKLWLLDVKQCHSGTCGIEKCDNNFVEKCGNLKIKQPALLGRNVTFTFTPDSYDPNAILEWQRAAERNPWFTQPLTYKFTQYNENGTYYMVLTDSLATNDEVNYRIHYYNESRRCRMETGKLKLGDNPNNPCGFVYQRNERVPEGGNIYLEYYPSKNANPVNYFTLEWAHSDTGYAPFTKFEGDIYKTDKTENGMKLLTIPMANISMNGYYKVKCGSNAGFTNTVSVTVLVRPSAPAFTNLQDIDECKECIVGSVKENIEVHCKTSGGTSPVDVTLTVGDKQVNSYMTRIILDNRHHNTVTCAVMNSALTSPLITTAKVYVIQSPVKVVLSTPRYLKQGSPVNITCQSQNSRPSPMVYLTISGINVSSADTMPTFNKETLLYNNATTLTTFKREWNGKDIICCSYNKWYKKPRYCSKPEQVNFLFPPSDIKLEIKFDSVDPLHMYAVCTLNNSNPVCRANFTAASRIIGSEKNSSNTSLPHGAWKTKYFVHLNVNKKDDGKDVTCAAVCADFQYLELRDTKTIKVPCKFIHNYLYKSCTT